MVEAIQPRINRIPGGRRPWRLKAWKESKVTQSVFSHSSRGGSISPIRLEAVNMALVGRSGAQCRHMECGGMVA
jgi:hypothetical protein